MQTCELPPASSYPSGPRGELDETAAGLGQAGRSRLLTRWAGLLLDCPAGLLLDRRAGLDGAEAVAALATALLLKRGSPQASLTAAAGAALLLADAWFDICTSPPGLDRTLAVGEAIFAELPLAAAAIWLAVTLIGRNR